MKKIGYKGFHIGFEGDSLGTITERQEFTDRCLLMPGDWLKDKIIGLSSFSFIFMYVYDTTKGKVILISEATKKKQQN